MHDQVVVVVRTAADSSVGVRGGRRGGALRLAHSVVGLLLPVVMVMMQILLNF